MKISDKIKKKSKKTTISIRVDNDVLKRLKNKQKKNGTTMTAFFNASAEIYLEEK